MQYNNGYDQEPMLTARIVVNATNAIQTAPGTYSIYMKRPSAGMMPLRIFFLPQGFAVCGFYLFSDFERRSKE